VVPSDSTITRVRGFNQGRRLSDEKVEIWSRRPHDLVGQKVKKWGTNLVPLGAAPNSPKDVDSRLFRCEGTNIGRPTLVCNKSDIACKVGPQGDRVTGHSHLMAHTPTIAPNAQERICDVCLTAGIGIHDGTTHHLLTGCCIPSIKQAREQLDINITNTCNNLNAQWHRSNANVNNALLFANPIQLFQWTTFDTNPKQWLAAILLDEQALCFQTARQLSNNNKNYSETLWSPIIDEIAIFVTTTLRTHQHYHKYTRKLRINRETWQQSIKQQTQIHNYTTHTHTQLLL
jgi:hypothetical protein